MVKDDDPDGSKALSSPDGLERAAKLLNPLTTLAKKNPEIWIAIYDVAVRRSEQSRLNSIVICNNFPSLEKHLQAVKALSYVHALNPDHPELHIRLIDFKKTCTIFTRIWLFIRSDRVLQWFHFLSNLPHL